MYYAEVSETQVAVINKWVDPILQCDGPVFLDCEFAIQGMRESDRVMARAAVAHSMKAGRAKEEKLGAMSIQFPPLAPSALWNPRATVLRSFDKPRESWVDSSSNCLHVYVGGKDAPVKAKIEVTVGSVRNPMVLLSLRSDGCLTRKDGVVLGLPPWGFASSSTHAWQMPTGRAAIQVAQDCSCTWVYAHDVGVRCVKFTTRV